LGSSHNQIGGRTDTPGTGLGNVISGNGIAGIQLAVAGDNIVEGNLIGTDPTGMLPSPNGIGIKIDGPSSKGTRIGGMDVESRNVISGNLTSGIEVGRSGSGEGAGVTIQSNFIGTDIEGGEALGNEDDGISLFGPLVHLIGGPEPVAGNLISGNGENGITSYTNHGVVIQNNRIGISAVDEALGNSKSGIRLYSGVRDAQILDNVISGNTQHGIRLDGSTVDSTGHRIVGNKVGTDPSGERAIGNQLNGLFVR